MHDPQSRIASFLVASALALGLTGCGKTDEQTAGQPLDSAVSRGESPVGEARRRADEAASAAGDRIEEGASRLGDAASQAADNARTLASDTTITAEIKAALLKDTELSALQISVDTQSGTVTLHGTAPSDQAKARAEQIAKGVKGVVAVSNQLAIQPR